MMPLNIKGSVCVCVSVGGCGIMCLWQRKARVTYLPDIRHTLSVCVPRILSVLLSILRRLTRLPA